MIDWWLFMLFNMLVLTLTFHTYLGYFISNAKKRLQNGNQIKVRPINYDNGKEDADNDMTKEKVLVRINTKMLSNANKGLQNRNQIKVRPINYDNGKEDVVMTKENVLIQAIWLNRIANIVFVVFMILFNIIFWIVAFWQYFRSEEEYINN